MWLDYVLTKNNIERVILISYSTNSNSTQIEGVGYLNLKWDIKIFWLKQCILNWREFRSYSWADIMDYSIKKNTILAP